LQAPITLTICQPEYFGSSILASKHFVDGEEVEPLDAILKGNIIPRCKKRILPKHLTKEGWQGTEKIIYPYPQSL
jgi:hypothetical protein